jgi:wobble nucleotide-excising tRNase
MNLTEIAQSLKQAKENIILLYAFNSTGKTQLSVEYKNLTKKGEGQHAGVYYNAYSEDLFAWENDVNNTGEKKKLKITPSSLNKYHSLLTEDAVKEKLIPYNPNYNFFFNQKKDTTDFDSVSFFKEGDEETPIKISRGEERIFVWCFFLALFEVEGWIDEQDEHFFIDDPVSSLDDHNIFITASLMLELIEKHCDHRKIIITTHHFGIFSTLGDWLRSGEKASKFKEKKIIREEKQEGDKTIIKEKEVDVSKFKICFLEKKNGEYKLVGKNKGILLYHLVLLQLLNEANVADKLESYHFVLLRQLLENISSFLGKGRFGYVLEKIGVEEKKMPDIINALSHQKVYYEKMAMMNDTEKGMFSDVFEKLKVELPFEL